jgi:hypothetical protein
VQKAAARRGQQKRLVFFVGALVSHWQTTLFFSGRVRIFAPFCTRARANARTHTPTTRARTPQHNSARLCARACTFLFVFASFRAGPRRETIVMTLMMAKTGDRHLYRSKTLARALILSLLFLLLLVG